MTETQTDASTETKSRRGRPRPKATLDRDAAVLEALQSGPKTTAQLAEALSVEKSVAYLSVFRLKRDGKISGGRSGSGSSWTLVSAE